MTTETQRRSECPLRRAGTCGDVDVALGWTEAMPLSSCDECWKLRAAGAEEAARSWREDYTEGVILTVKGRGVETYPARIRAAMFDRHLDCHEAKVVSAKLQNAPKPKPAKVRWLWIDWYGVPWPKRPYIAGRVALATFFKAMRQLAASGCGCISALKDLTNARSPQREQRGQASP